MWFDNLIEEEIRQRLLKEGVWTELLKDAALDERDEERIAQAKQEIQNTEEYEEFLELATQEMLLPLLSGITVPDNVEIKQYRSIQAKRNHVGEVIMHLMARAEKSIYVTHFIRDKFPKHYHALQLEKVRQGIILERIVYFHEGSTDGYQWLDQFLDENSNPIGNYKEYEIQTNQLLPFDLMIIDEKYAILAYRTSPADEVMIFENDCMVKCLLDIWRNLRPQQDRKGRYKTWKTTVTPTQRGSGI
jgi:hypothetical protein